MSREPSKTEGNNSNNNNNNNSNAIDLILAGVVMSGRRNGTPRRYPRRRHLRRHRAGLDNHCRNGEENIIVNKNKNNAARPRAVRLEPRTLPKISWTYCWCSCHVVVFTFQ